MRFLSKYLLICTTLALAMVGVSSVAAYADEDASAIADDQVVVVSEQSNDVAPDVGIEPEYDRGSGSYAESWRYSQGILTSESDCSAQSMSRSGVNSWWKEGSTWVSADGTRVSGAKAMGIDVSMHQGQIDWGRVKSSGVNYAIIRCGYGSDYSEQDDPQFLRNVSECMKRGIPFGVYIYSYAYNTSMAQSEANHVLRLLNAAGLTPGKVSYPIYFDLENQGSNGRPGASGHSISNSTLASMASTFCGAIENAGYRAGVYANLNWWNSYLTSSVFDNWSKWVAQYNSSCWYSKPYDMWQCMSDGSVPGISTNVDVNFDFTGLGSESSEVWNRVYGQGQIDTMQAISKTGWSSSNSVVIATDSAYWDALSASSLAGSLDCPVLLTYPDSLASQTAAEIKRLGAKTAYICGGPLAISTTVDARIQALGCTNVVRVYGQDHQGTSRAIADKVQANDLSTCIIATSQSFQDALSISPYAYANNIPIYLCEGGTNSVSSDTLKSIKSKQFKNAIIVGGPIAVDSGVESKLKSAGITNVQRIYGQTEYETSNSIAKWCVQHGMTANNMAVATGTQYFDALAGAALCGKNNSVLVIVSDWNRVAITDFVSANKSAISNGFVFGGELAVSRNSWDTLVRYSR